MPSSELISETMSVSRTITNPSAEEVEGRRRPTVQPDVGTFFYLVLPFLLFCSSFLLALSFVRARTLYRPRDFQQYCPSPCSGVSISISSANTFCLYNIMCNKSIQHILEALYYLICIWTDLQVSPYTCSIT